MLEPGALGSSDFGGLAQAAPVRVHILRGVFTYRQRTLYLCHKGPRALYTLAVA